MLEGLRSLLFAPGSDEPKLTKALASDADVVVADLEDAVTPDRKDEARELVLRLRPPVVRVNGADTRWFEDDLAAARELPLEALVLPKATPDAVAALGAEGPPVIAIVETAQGLRLAYETASSPRVAALLLGAADLGAELGWEPRPDGLEVLYARSKVVADSAAAAIRGPVRHRPPRHPRRGGARGRRPLREVARFPRQGLYPPGAGRRSSTACSSPTPIPSRGRSVCWRRPSAASTRAAARLRSTAR